MEPENTRLPMRRANRLAAVQFIYMWEVNRPSNIQSAFFDFLTNFQLKAKQYKFAQELAMGTLENLQDCDTEIKQYSKNWSFDRIAKTDLAILRLAIYELLFRTDIPPIVTINEAIDLTKMLSGAESKRFVNGILDQVKAKLTRPLRTAQEEE